MYDLRGQFISVAAPTLREAWVRLERAELLPRAKKLLSTTRAQNIAVFFVTNRTLTEEPATLENLKALGVSVIGHRQIAPQLLHQPVERRSLEQGVVIRVRDEVSFRPGEQTPSRCEICLSRCQ